MLLNIHHPVLNMQPCRNADINRMSMFLHTQYWSLTCTTTLEKRTCRTLAPTLFLKANDLCVRAKAVPRCAVVNSLEVSWDNVTHGQGGDDTFLGGYRLNGVTAWCSWLQHGLLPRPGLRKSKSVRKGCFWPSRAELSCESMSCLCVCRTPEMFAAHLDWVNGKDR